MNFLNTAERRIAFLNEIALYALAALCALPFLIPLHTLPIGSFYSEWVALLIGLLSFPALLAAPTVRLPHIALLPMVLAGLILMQRLILQPAYSEPASIALLYLLWAAFVITTAANLAAALGRDAVIHRIACWLLAGSLINACCVLLFVSGVIGQNFPLRTSPPGNIFLAQANHLAHYLWLGLASALYLFHTRRIPGWLLTLFAIPLLLASALTTSRASLPYALWLIALTWLCAAPRLRRPTVAIAAVYVLLLLGLPYLGLGGSDNALTRMLAELGPEKVHGASIRLALIKAGWLAFLDHPLLGAGFASYTWAVFQHIDSANGWQGTAEHAHQIFINLLAELGFVAPLILLTGLVLWCKRLWPQRTQAYGFWIAAVTGIGFAHAQVEYPLWYAHFLGVFALGLGLAETQFFTLRSPRWFWLLAPGFGLVLLGSVLHDYAEIERWTYVEATRPLNAAPPPGYFNPLLSAGKGSLLRPWADARIAAAMAASPEQLENKLTLCDNILPFNPVTPTVFNCALIYALDGREEQGRALWRRGEHLFGDDAAAYRSAIEQETTAGKANMFSAVMRRK